MIRSDLVEVASNLESLFRDDCAARDYLRILVVLERRGLIHTVLFVLRGETQFRCVNALSDLDFDLVLKTELRVRVLGSYAITRQVPIDRGHNHVLLNFPDLRLALTSVKRRSPASATLSLLLATIGRSCS